MEASESQVSTHVLCLNAVTKTQAANHCELPAPSGLPSCGMGLPVTRLQSSVAVLSVFVFAMWWVEIVAMADRMRQELLHHASHEVLTLR